VCTGPHRVLTGCHPGASLVCIIGAHMSPQTCHPDDPYLTIFGPYAQYSLYLGLYLACIWPMCAQALTGWIPGAHMVFGVHHHIWPESPKKGEIRDIPGITPFGTYQLYRGSCGDLAHI
jgi:hypothetical protein